MDTPLLILDEYGYYLVSTPMGRNHCPLCFSPDSLDPMTNHTQHLSYKGSHGILEGISGKKCNSCHHVSQLSEESLTRYNQAMQELIAFVDRSHLRGQHVLL